MPKHDPNILQQAVASVTAGVHSTRAAAKIFKIPRSTLMNHCKRHHADRPGPSPVLSVFEEAKVVSYVQDMAKIGYPQTWQQICETVKMVLDLGQRKTIFKNNLPGNIHTKFTIIYCSSVV